MDNEIKVSVVLPVYNVEDYIRECLDSLVGQTLKEIEIILVNDGSIDGTLEIMEEYEKKDSRITIITQENKGAGAARNTGLRVAKGKYIIFLDPDDFFEVTLLEELYNKSVLEDAEITICQSITYNETTKEYKTHGNFKVDLLPEKSTFNKNDTEHILWSLFKVVPWNKMYKLNFIINNNLEFQEIYRNDDTYFGAISLYMANKITTLDKILIYHRIGIFSSTSKFNKFPLEVYKAWEKIIVTLKFLNIPFKELQKILIEPLISILDILKQISSYESFEKLYSYIKENGEKDFNFLCLENTTYHNYNLEIYKNILSNPIDKFIFISRKNNNRFKTLLWERISFSELCFYGSGKNCNDVLKFFKIKNLDLPMAICDNNPNKQGQEIDGIPIISIDEAVNKYKNLTLLITSRAYSDEIYFKAKDYIDEENIFLIPDEQWFYIS